jgi:hypothetical protein
MCVSVISADTSCSIMGCLGDEDGQDVRAATYRLLRHLVVDQHDVNQLQTHHFDMFLVRCVGPPFPSTHIDAVLPGHSREITSLTSRRSRLSDSSDCCYHSPTLTDQSHRQSFVRSLHSQSRRRRSSDLPVWRLWASFVSPLLALLQLRC